MDATYYAHEAIESNSVFGVTVILVAGLVIAGALIWAVRFGGRVRRREQDPRRPEPPSRDSGPAEAAGPLHETRQIREPDEVPQAENDGDRLTSHDLKGQGTRRAGDQTRPRWGPRSSGSFGSGGPGST